MSRRIAMVCACPYPAPLGSQVLIKDTALALQRAGHDVRIVSYGFGEGDDGGIPVHRCPNVPGYRRIKAGPSIAKPFIDIMLVRTLKKVIREFSIDVVHAHNYEGLIAALMTGKRPVVYHAHNAMADELPCYFRGGNIARRFGAWLDAAFPKRAGMIIAPHARLAEYLVKNGCKEDRISIVPPCANAYDFNEPEYGEAPADVLYTGNLDAYQNMKLLYDAMDIIRGQDPEVKLNIVTGGNFTELKTILARDAIVVCPRVSWSGYPIKILNAMAAGRPVIACRSACGPIIDGVNGILVDDNDACAFADAVLNLRVNHVLRKELGQNARGAILRDHAPEVIAEQIMRGYP